MYNYSEILMSLTVDINYVKKLKLLKFKSGLLFLFIYYKIIYLYSLYSILYSHFMLLFI